METLCLAAKLLRDIPRVVYCH